MAKRGPKGIDWDAEPLGVETDVAIAKRRGCHPSAVLHARRKRGIAAAQGKGHLHRGIDWDAEPLGKVPDMELVRLHNVWPSVVCRARQARGIPRYKAPTKIDN